MTLTQRLAYLLAFSALVLAGAFALAVLGAQGQWALPKDVPTTCQPAKSDDICVVAFTGEQKPGATVLTPLPKVAVLIGNEALLTNDKGFVTVDVPRQRHQVRAVAPIGYQADPGAVYDPRDHAPAIVAVRILSPIK